MDFAEAIARGRTLAVADGVGLISPGRQAGIDIIFVCEDFGSITDDLGNDRLNGGLLNIRQQGQNDLAIPLAQTEDRWFLFLQRSPAAPAFEPVAPARPAFF